MPFERSATDWERRVKVCSACNQEKPFEDFYFSKTRGGGGIYAQCKACCNAATKARREARTDEEKKLQAAAHRSWKQRTYPLRRDYERRRGWIRRFGLTPEDYGRLLDSQGSCCAICRNPVAEDTVLAVDHDHETGEIRGLLCNGCNVGLGRFRDNAAALRRAISYLRNPPARRVLNAQPDPESSEDAAA